MRVVVAHHLEGAPWPVHQFLPDDIGALPAICVPRVQLLPHPDTHGVVEGSVHVLVVGSRLTSDEHAAELDSVADLVVGRFGNVVRSIRLESVMVPAMRVDECNPTTVTIGGTEFPCYAITLVGTLNPAC